MKHVIEKEGKKNKISICVKYYGHRSPHALGDVLVAGRKNHPRCSVATRGDVAALSSLAQHHWQHQPVLLGMLPCYL